MHPTTNRPSTRYGIEQTQTLYSTLCNHKLTQTLHTFSSKSAYRKRLCVYAANGPMLMLVCLFALMHLHLFIYLVILIFRPFPKAIQAITVLFFIDTETST